MGEDGQPCPFETITGGAYSPGGLKLQCDENGNPIKQRLGNTVAPLTGGFGFNGNVGNFDFNLFFNYSLGNVIINGTKLASSFRSGSRTGYNLNNDFALGNRYTWIDPETGLNLANSSSAVLETYGSMTEAGLRLNQLNRNASIFHRVSIMRLIRKAVRLSVVSILRSNSKYINVYESNL